MEYLETSAAQASKYLLQVSANQDRWRSDEMLAGEAGQFGGGHCHERAPRRPVLEIGDRIAGRALTVADRADDSKGPRQAGSCYVPVR